MEEGAQMFILKPVKQSDVKQLTGQLMNLGRFQKNWSKKKAMQDISPTL